MPPDSGSVRPHGRLPQGAVARLATIALTALAVLSVTVRPVVEVTGLPDFLINLDALLAPVAAGVVLVAAILDWGHLARMQRWLTVLAGVMAVSMLSSWLTATPRSFASLALGSAMLLLLPLMLYVTAMAASAPIPAFVRRALLLMVLLQLAVGLVQYVALSVAQKAPAGADLVDGTTSHNFWPVFALPASLALVLSGRERWRLVWPVAVVVLAVYSEAKAALIVWLPLIGVLLAAEGLLAARRARSVAQADGSRDHMPPDRIDSVIKGGAVLAAVAVTVVGLWWTPSVQGTWRVFLGHSQTLEQFAVAGDEGDTSAPTLREAVTRLQTELTATPRAFFLGLGPANSTSHAAEVLAQGAKNGVSLPPPGPVAAELLTDADAIKFRDAQSSVLGTWGDLGALGVAVYLALCLGCTYALFAPAGVRAAVHSPRAWAVPGIVGGLIAGGSLLDWPEQASVVLPVLLALLVLAQPQTAIAETEAPFRAQRPGSPPPPAEPTAGRPVRSAAGAQLERNQS